MAMKGYSKFTISPELKFYHQIKLSFQLRKPHFEGFLPLYNGYSKCIRSPNIRVVLNGLQKTGGIGERIGTNQTTELMKSVRIFNRILLIRGDLLSLRVWRKAPVKSEVKNSQEI